VLGGPLLIETIIALENGTLKPIKQNDDDSSHAPLLSKEMSQIDFSLEALLVHNLIRGLSEWPCAQTVINGKRLKVYKSEVVEIDEKTNIGEIISTKQFIVGCGKNTAIRLCEVQYEGSKRMNGADFLRGQRIQIGDFVGIC